MPKEVERKLKAQARKKGLKGERADAYVYGMLREMGWKPKREKHHSASDGEFLTSRKERFGV